MKTIAVIILTVFALVFSCNPLSDFDGNKDNGQDGQHNPSDEVPETPSENGSGATGGYTLVWQDLFNGEALDENVWNIEVNGDGGGNAELQYYRRENVRVGKDETSGRNCLILTAKKEAYWNKSFTSGRINSNNRKSFRYGKIEALIKLPRTADGLWPAFWLMGENWDADFDGDGQNDGWPKCGEIDILEMGNSTGIAQGTQDRYFNGACHWGFYKEVSPGNWAYPNYANASVWDYSLQDGEFHLYTILWDESKIRMYVDMDRYPDKDPYYEITISGQDGEWAVDHYFHHEYFILFNLAVGGRFTGILQPGGITAFPESGEASMYVDYVKVYQK